MDLKILNTQEGAECATFIKFFEKMWLRHLKKKLQLILSEDKFTSEFFELFADQGKFFRKFELLFFFPLFLNFSKFEFPK